MRHAPALLCTLALAGLAAAQTVSDPQALLTRGPLKPDGSAAPWAHAGLLVQDAATGETLFAWHDNESFTPASNMKVLTTAAALYALGPAHTFQTRALGPQPTGGRVARLTLVGSGDPMLTEKGAGDSLEALAKAVAASGVREVTELRVDDSALNWPRWASGWMWDDTEFPIGALHLDGDGAPYGELVLGEDELKAGQQPNPLLITDASVLPLEVGTRFQALLLAAGVQTTGAPKLARAESGDTALAQVSSEPLADILRDTNKESVNIHAEQLLAALGVGEGGTPGTPDRSAAAITAFLKTVGYTGPDPRLRDGSGLSRYNLVTPQLLAAVLRYAYLNPRAADGSAPTPQAAFDGHANAFIESLPVAGTGTATPADAARGGTLAKRLVGSGLDLRAKTGSMTGVASVSGYLKAGSGRLLTFSLLMDNYPGPLSDLTRWQDEVLKALAARY